MNNENEIRKRLGKVRQQLLELEREIQNSQKIASSQYNEQEIRKKLGNVRKQVLELEKEIQDDQKTASSQYDDVSQIALQSGSSLTEDQVYVANAIVQQASRRIHDLRLHSATGYSDTEIEAASRSFIRQGRKSYLDVTRVALQLEKGKEGS